MDDVQPCSSQRVGIAMEKSVVRHGLPWSEFRCDDELPGLPWVQSLAHCKGFCRLVRLAIDLLGEIQSLASMFGLHCFTAMLFSVLERVRSERL